MKQASFHAIARSVEILPSSLNLDLLIEFAC